MFFTLNFYTSRVRVNTSEENRDVQPEDFDVVSHQSVLMEGMNQLRLKEHLLDVKLKAEGRYFKVRNKILKILYTIAYYNSSVKSAKTTQK